MSANPDHLGGDEDDADNGHDDAEGEDGHADDDVKGGDSKLQGWKTKISKWAFSVCMLQSMSREVFFLGGKVDFWSGCPLVG